MAHEVMASVVINNYNYGVYLGEAIESALAQTYPCTEVVVVDDGSVDASREILAAYGGRVRAVLKANGGQASALNAGFSRSRGDIILFLDADDVLLPECVARAVDLLAEAGTVKAHWPLWEVDRGGSKTGQVMPRAPLPEGDLRGGVIREGPEAYVSAPTSGNAWSRRFLERVFPLPEAQGYRLGGSDVYLSSLAPLFGRVRMSVEPLGCYRLHGRNNYSALDFERKLRQDSWCYDDRCLALRRFCSDLGVDVDPDVWKRNSWLYRFVAAREEIVRLIPISATLILVDQEEVGRELVSGRKMYPFLERDGEYWGAPENDETAIRELERLRRTGATFLVFAWPAFWWLEHYGGFRQYLEQRYPCMMKNERLTIFDLSKGLSLSSQAASPGIAVRQEGR
jgi:glycosyltransferase involved in cell wall biosynthesis